MPVVRQGMHDFDHGRLIVQPYPALGEVVVGKRARVNRWVNVNVKALQGAAQAVLYCVTASVEVTTEWRREDAPAVCNNQAQDLLYWLRCILYGAFPALFRWY